VYERLVQPNGGEDVPHNAIQHRVLCFGEFRVHSILGGNSGLKRRGGRRRIDGMMQFLFVIAMGSPQGEGQAGGSSWSQCICPIAAIGVICWLVYRWRERQRLIKKELKAAHKKYEEALSVLSQDNSSENKIRALEAGRSYAALSRLVAHGDKTVTIFDEVALTNDISARMND
jgi:hypothetical protein